VAVACFEQALDADALPEELRADARYNLELAKLLWAEAKARQGTRETPNQFPDEPPETKPPPAEDPMKEPGPGGTEPGTPQPGAQQVAGNGKAGGEAPRPTDRKAPGAGTLPVLADGPQPQKLSPEDARAILAREGERIDRDRKANARLLAGPERPHVRDW
jgi:hypothetical protein